MDTKVFLLQSKIKRLLYKFLEGRCPNRLETHFEPFFELLRSQEAAEVESAHRTFPIFAEWLKEAAVTWSSTKAAVPTNVVTFAMNLASVLSRKEERFSDLNSNNFFIKLINVSKARQCQSVKLSYVKLLSSFLEHDSGLEWIVASRFWEDVLKLSLSKTDTGVVEGSTRFVARLLEKTVDFDENFCDDVIKKIMMPLGNEASDIGDEVAAEALKPTLELMVNVLEYFLEGIYLEDKKFDVVFLFLENFHLEERLSDLMIWAQSKCLVFDLGKIMYVMQFLELYVKTLTGSAGPAGVGAAVEKIIHNFVLTISKGDFESVLDFCRFGVLYWSLLYSKIPKSRKDTPNGDFTVQVFFSLIIPVYYTVVKYFKSMSQIQDEAFADDLRSIYDERAWKMMRQDMIRCCFGWRDPLIGQDLLTLGTHSFTHIKRALRYLSKDQAVIIFQELTYASKDIVEGVKESAEKLDVFLQEPAYFEGMFGVFAMLVEHFQITWKDSVEALALIDFIFEFLSIHDWPPNVVVQVLKLINIAIVKYMSPNLALLVENPTDSIMDILGMLVSSKLLGEVTEVRRSALEVVCTMASLSTSSLDKPLRLISPEICAFVTMTRAVQCEIKIKRLLEKFLEGKFQVDGKVWEKFLAFISKQESGALFSEWIKKAVLIWNKRGVVPSTNIASFTLTVASLLSKDEQTFCSLNRNNFFIKLVTVLKARQSEAPEVKSGFIKLLLAFLEHKSGIEWMIACNFWENVLQMCFQSKDGDVVRESTRFVAILLEKSVDHDEDFCDTVVKRIMLPLGENVYKALKVSDGVDDGGKVAFQYLQPQLKLISEILTYFLDGSLLEGKEFGVAFIFLKNIHLEERISDFMLIAQNKYLFFEISKIMFIVQFLELYIKRSTHTISNADTAASINRIKTTFMTNFTKGRYDHVIQICSFGCLYWKLIISKIEPIHLPFFLEQIIMFEILPFPLLVRKHCYSNNRKQEESYEDEVRDVFATKVYKFLSTDCVRFYYFWREKLVAHPDLVQICTSGFLHVKQSFKYFTTEQSIIIFQCLIHQLSDIIQAVKKNPDKREIFLNEPNLFVLAFGIVTTLIQNFPITWQESLEVVDVISLCFHFLEVPQWHEDVVVQVLKLMNVAISKYMSPNLALLVDSTPNSATDLLGPLLYVKAGGTVQVRGAVLEVVYTIARLSADKSRLDAPFVAEWFQRAVGVWSTEEVVPSTNIASFTLILASFVSRNEGRFCRLNSDDFFINLVTVLGARQFDAAPTIKLGYIKLLSSFLEHESGIKWVLASAFWEDILQMGLSSDNEEVVKESTQLMSKFLEKVVNCDDDFCESVVKRIVLPVRAGAPLQELAPLLQLIVRILHHFLERILLHNDEFRVVLIFFKVFYTEGCVSDLMTFTQTRDLHFNSSVLVSILQFLELYVKASTGSVSTDEIYTILHNIKMAAVATNSKEDKFERIIKFCNFGVLFWNLVESKILVSHPKNANWLSPADELLLLLTVPDMCLLIKYCYSTVGKMEERTDNDEVRTIYFDKLMKLVTNEGSRFFYLWRDRLVANPELFEICIQCNTCSEQLQKYLSNGQAVRIAAHLIYVITDTTATIKKYPELFAVFRQQSAFFLLIFRALTNLVKDFAISWRNSLEVVDIMSLCFDVLKLPEWPEDLVVQILKLINVAILRYISPNLALLVDSTTNSAIDLLGPLLYVKSHGPPEVRRTVLEVIHTVSQLSIDIRAYVMSRAVQLVSKIDSLLEKFLSGTCGIDNDRLDKFLALLSRQKSTAFAEWLKRAVRSWDTNHVVPSTNIAAFTLSLASLVSKNEEGFRCLNSNNFFVKLVTVVKARQGDAALGVKLAYVELLGSFLEHQSGTEWMIGCNFWESVLEMSLTANDALVRESTRFLAVLLERTIDYDKDFVDGVVKRILLPLGENLYKALKIPDFEIASKYLRPQLRLIEGILVHFFDGILRYDKDFRVVLIFSKNFHFQDRISDFMAVAKNKYLSFDISKLILTIQFLQLYSKSSTRTMSTKEIEASVNRIRRTSLANCAKEEAYENVLQYCSFGVVYWKLIEAKILAAQSEGRFSTELIALALVPNAGFLIKHCHRTVGAIQKILDNDEIRDIFMDKAYKLVSNDAKRCLFSWRERIVASTDIVDTCVTCMSSVKDLQKYLSIEQAVLVCQHSIYIVKDIITHIKNHPDSLPIFVNEPRYFSHLFELIAVVLDKFPITWKESLEVVEVLSLCLDFVQLPEWQPGVTKEILKLVNVAIRKYTSPNLALLLDSTANSTMDLLGSLLYAKSRDVLEVRTAVFEVIYTIAHLSATKLQGGLVSHPVFAQWITQAVTNWYTDEVTPPPNIAAFTLNLASFLSKTDDGFCQLNNKNFFIKLVKVSKARRGTAPSVTSAYIKLLSAFLDNTSGLEWMISCNFWEDVYELSVSQECDAIVEESTKFMSKLLEKSIDYDEGFCDRVIKKMMLPLGENIYKSLKASADIDEEVATLHLMPTLKLIGNVLCYFMDGIYLRKNDFGVALVFLKNFHLEERISDFMIIAQSKCLVYHLAKIMFVMQLLELFVKKITQSASVASIQASVKRIRGNFLGTLSKKEFTSMTEICGFGVLFWNLIETRLDKTVSLAKDLVLILATCNFMPLMKYCYNTVTEIEDLIRSDEIRQIYTDKMLKDFSMDVLRICYGFRDDLLAREDLFKYCRRSLVCIKDVRKYFVPEQALLIFQTVVYIASDIIRALKEKPEKMELFLEEPEYFCHIFELLRFCIEEFPIKWRDSFETFEVMDVCFDYLSLPEWPPSVVVELLKLLNVTIANYMSPNLALLADSATDSSITLLGPLLYSKSRVNEVKVPALTVIQTIAAMSSSKFPSLQKVLMDSELPTLVVKMSTCDGESFVRATAIKCLQEMIQVEEIWNNALKTEDLQQKMRDILLNETEGIVRVEAATFMCVAYENQQFQKENLDQIYETMIYSSTTDLHWEVKVRALNFWDKVIKNHLQNQGMIDDSFPNVTFSKEHRKIVTLTDSEIRKRLLKVLSQLSAIGCLGVLMSAIKDDCDMEVSKTAVKITQRLVDLFKKYNLRSDFSAPTSPAPTENGTVSVSSGVSVDESMDSPRSSHPDLNEEIIDQIVNAKDVCLLKNVYSPSDYGSVSNYDIQVRKVVTPNEFLQFTQQDLNNLITEKKNWLNGIEDLGSLLDDMLKTYEDDVNNMDCY